MSGSTFCLGLGLGGSGAVIQQNLHHHFSLTRPPLRFKAVLFEPLSREFLFPTYLVLRYSPPIHNHPVFLTLDTDGFCTTFSSSRWIPFFGHRRLPILVNAPRAAICKVSSSPST